MKKQPKKRKTPSPKWDETHYADIYDLARQGHTEAEIARFFNVSRETWNTWKKRRPAISKILNRPECYRSGSGRDGKGHVESLSEYVYRHLDEHLQAVWDKIHAWQNERNGVRKIQLFLANQSKQAKQTLFLHALAVSRFNPTRACRKIGLTRNTFLDWCETDPDFHALFKQFDAIRKDFFEESLFVKCKGHWTKDEKNRTIWMPGDTKAIIFANSTANKEKYGRSIDQTITHREERSIQMQAFIERMPPEMAQKMLEIMDEVEGKEKPIDAEYEVKDNG